MLKSIAAFFGRALLRMAMDRGLQVAIRKAIRSAENSTMKGAEKMDYVLREVKQSGAKALLDETESTLRTKIELALDDLKV